MPEDPLSRLQEELTQLQQLVNGEAARRILRASPPQPADCALRDCSGGASPAADTATPPTLSLSPSSPPAPAPTPADSSLRSVRALSEAVGVLASLHRTLAQAFAADDDDDGGCFPDDSDGGFRTAASASASDVDSDDLDDLDEAALMATKPWPGTVLQGSATHQLLPYASARIGAYMRLALDEEEPPLPVRPAPSPEALAAQLDLALPAQGLGPQQVCRDLDMYLARCVRTHVSGFMNPLWGGVRPSSLVGEMLTAATNTSMYTFELAPVATLIEKTVLEHMCNMAGFVGGTGTFVTGGSNGNMLGMLCGRYHCDPALAADGLGGAHAVAFVSDVAHYSVLMAGSVIGLGTEGVIKVPTDDEGRMLVPALRAKIAEARAAGRRPVCIIATAGTTVQGAFDPVEEIVAVGKAENIWVHVDAAWGGACLLSDKHRHLLAGCSNADSICWDAHKLMNLPLVCSAFMVRDKAILGNVCSFTRTAHYLLHEESAELDLGNMSLQCGRRNDALKLWMTWRELGDDGWALHVDKCMALADYLQQRVEAEPRLEMVSARHWTNVCFRCVPRSGGEAAANALNAAVRHRLLSGGKFMVTRANIGNKIILRAVMTNPMITQNTLDRFLAEILQLATDFEAGLLSPLDH